MIKDELVGWHHQLNGHDFEYIPGIDDGQGGLACCSPWGHKELDKTLQSPLDSKEIKPVHPKETSPEYSLEGLMLKLKLQHFGQLM